MSITNTYYTEQGNGGTNITVDGRVFSYNNSGTSFSNLRSLISSSLSAQPTATVSYMAELFANTTSNLYNRLSRGFFTFNTIDIPSDATIISASINLYPTSKAVALGDTSLNIVESTEEDNNYIDNSTFNKINNVVFASRNISSITTNSYNIFQFNQDGLNSIKKGNISKYAILLGWDLNNSFTGTWSSGGTTGTYIRQAEIGSLANTPFLSVEYEINNQVIVNKYQMML